MKTIFTTIVIFFNGRREAQRTLHTLSSEYQNINSDLYNVLVLDSGSSEPLIQSEIEAFGPNFTYKYVQSNYPSPIEALRLGLELCETPYINVCIDGARMLSPGIFNYFLDILNIDSDPFVITTGFHIGKYHQNFSILEGYNQNIEDELLDYLDWQNNGYRLFNISTLKQDGYSFFSRLAESNCFFVKTETLKSIGFNPGFISKGGGLINLSVFRDLIEIKKLNTYHLVGEATFHQFHGGAASNISMEDHPVQEYKEEYRNIMGKEFISPKYSPIYYGEIKSEIETLRPKYASFHILKTVNYLVSQGREDEAIKILELAKKDHPYHTVFLVKLNKILIKKGEIDLALKYINEALNILPQHPHLYLSRSRIYNALNKWEESKVDLQQCIKLSPNIFTAYLDLYENYEHFNLNESQAFDDLINHNQHINKQQDLRRFINILIKKNDRQSALEALESYIHLFNDDHEGSLLKFQILRKSDNQKALDQAADQLSQDVIADPTMSLKLKKRICQILVNHEYYSLGKQILVSIKEFKNEVSNNKREPSEEKLFEAILNIMPKVNKQKAQAFVSYLHAEMKLS